VVNVVPTRNPGEVVDTILDDPGSASCRSPAPPGSASCSCARRRTGSCACRLELGGNAPFIVCADADIEKAVDGAMVAKMRNIGQACTAANRFFVERSVATSSPRRSRPGSPT
jgi:succinate-semialdehyde dehydrogenase / glutarate-semialdehyde dehydrogenase